MYFSLCENIMCGVRVPWLVRRNNSNEGRVFAKGQLGFFLFWHVDRFLIVAACHVNKLRNAHGVQ